jgi:DNA-directed RNA polymerase subunit RPC12/RpoP
MVGKMSQLGNVERVVHRPGHEGMEKMVQGGMEPSQSNQGTVSVGAGGDGVRKDLKLYKCLKCKSFFWGPPGRSQWLMNRFTGRCRDCGGVLMGHVENKQRDTDCTN